VDTDAPRVLVADDDPDILMLLASRLERRGYEVIQARNGEEALAAAGEHIPDAAVFDGVMPKLEGHEVCAAMRKDKRTAGIPVILLTAKAGDDARTAALESGADDYMVKPFSFDALDQRLRELIEGGRS
jgi:DNA-binding response OmpR family regulator